MQIEHNRHERRPTNRIWWALWAFIAALWVGFSVLVGFDWPSIALGVLSGGAMVAWATDLTGNRFMG